MLASQLCKQADFETAVYQAWAKSWEQPIVYKRKQWEFFFICQALGNVRGKHGLGFGVGREPMAARLVKAGAHVLATDRPSPGVWAQSNQHAGGLADIPYGGIVTERQFRQRASFRPVDMNHIPRDLRDGTFDFVWSSSAMDHLGGLYHGLAFVYNAMSCLRPGGIAAHTTEFNLSSNDKTLDNGDLVLFRQRDIERLANELTAAGHKIELDLARGDMPHDLHISQPPYDKEPHLRLEIANFHFTSIGLVIQRGGG
jgi:hypothetical protein